MVKKMVKNGKNGKIMVKITNRCSIVKFLY